MKKNISITLWVLIILTGAIFAKDQNTEGVTGKLIVKIQGFTNYKGSAMIALCNSKEGFKNTNKAYKTIAAPIKAGKVEWIFNNIPYGIYAVKVYHDENSNKKLDTGAFGIPKEVYGFSNNARGTFGPPKYEEAQFQFNKTDLTINITVK